jgi:hypothetical protein
MRDANRKVNARRALVNARCAWTAFFARRTDSLRHAKSQRAMRKISAPCGKSMRDAKTGQRASRIVGVCIAYGQGAMQNAMRGAKVNADRALTYSHTRCNLAKTRNVAKSMRDTN